LALDFVCAVAGPMAIMSLPELGARVVKVERLGGG